MFGRSGRTFGRMGAIGSLWTLDGASLDLDFVNARGWQDGAGQKAASDFLTTTRASDAYADNTAGVWSLFGSGVPRITDKGLLVEEARTNLFLNSGVPATQSITVVAATVYTVSVVGTGSVTLSNAGSGTVSQGSPVTFTAGSATLTCTTAGITGAFVNVNVEAGASASTPIRTAGTSATREADAITTAMVGTAEGAVVLYARTPPVDAVAQTIWQWDDGAANNRLLVWRSSGTLYATSVVGGVGQASINLGVVANNTDLKVGFAWKANDFAAVLNGGAPVTDVSGSVPAGLTTIRHGAAHSVSNPWNSLVMRESDFPTRLTNAQLQALTA